jgi:NADH-quinone oxidoreductase subunit F
LKWQFVLKDTPKPKYIACNADESEPGTFKDHVLMERNPHLLIEGCAIGCYAIGAKVAYIYIRGEFCTSRSTSSGDRRGYRAGYLGKNILGSGFRLRRLRASRRRRVRSRRGDRAHRVARRQARAAASEAAVSAVAGLYQCPTAVNNVETLCNVPLIVLNGPEWFAALGPEKNGGPKLFCISGHVKRRACMKRRCTRRCAS